MKKIIITTIVLTLFSTSSAFAAQDLGGQRVMKEVTKVEARATNSATKQDASLVRLQNTASSMIDRRIASLNSLLSRVNNDARLTSDEKTAFATDIQQTMTDLTNLKSKILADTDATSARADAKTIVTSYHIYLIFEPKERLSVIIDNLLTVTTNIQALSTQIQGLLTTLASEGKDTTVLQTYLTDINAKLSDATTKLQADKTTLSTISLTQDPTTAKTTFIKVRTDLAAVKQDFTTIRNDFAKLTTGIKALSGVNPTVTASTPTPTP